MDATSASNFDSFVSNWLSRLRIQLLSRSCLVKVYRAILIVLRTEILQQDMRFGLDPLLKRGGEARL